MQKTPPDFFDANLQYFAQVLYKFNNYGVRSYAKVQPLKMKKIV